MEAGSDGSVRALLGGVKRRGRKIKDTIGRMNFASMGEVLHGLAAEDERLDYLLDASLAGVRALVTTGDEAHQPLRVHGDFFALVVAVFLSRDATNAVTGRSECQLHSPVAALGVAEELLERNFDLGADGMRFLVCAIAEMTALDFLPLPRPRVDDSAEARRAELERIAWDASKTNAAARARSVALRLCVAAPACIDAVARWLVSRPVEVGQRALKRALAAQLAAELPGRVGRGHSSPVGALRAFALADVKDSSRGAERRGKVCGAIQTVLLFLFQTFPLALLIFFGVALLRVPI